MDDDEAAARLWHALRAGHRDDAVAAVLDLSPKARRRQLPGVRRHDRVVGDAPEGGRAPAGEWSGELRSGHWSAAAAAVLGCSPLERAVTYAPLIPQDSADLPKALFPDQLDAFVHEWSARYLRNPKAWDRIRGLAAMFDWAHEGLVPPPTDDGAVLLLVTAVPRAHDGPDLLHYLESRPGLIDGTLRLIFDVDGIKGASLAQRDQGVLPGSRMVDFVVPELVRRGHWSVDFVEDGIARALARGQSRYLARWFEELARQMSSLRPDAASGRMPG